MNRYRAWCVAAVVAAVSVVGVACGGGGGGGEASSEVVAEGRSLYLKNCSSCHGNDANGLPNLGVALTTSDFVRRKSDAELIEYVKTGRPVDHPENKTGIAMPPKGGNPALTEEQIVKIIAYLRTVQI